MARSVVRLTPEEQYQIAVDELRGAQRRVQQPNAAALAGLMIPDPEINRAAQSVLEQQQNIGPESALARTLGGWAESRQRAEENAALRQTLTGMQAANQRARADERFAQQAELQRMREEASERDIRLREDLRRSRPTPISRKDVESLIEYRSHLRGLNDLMETFQDDYAGNLPVAGPLENWAARHGGPPGRFLARQFGSEGDPVEQSDWWAKYEEILTLPDRHEAFGAALTKTEEASWKKMDVSPQTDPETVRRRLQRRIDFYNEKMKDHYAGRGIDPVAAFEPDEVEQTTEVGPGGAAQTTTESGPEGTAVTVEGAEGAPDLSTLSEEEFQKLLREAYGG